jgi:hypothetical protein
MVALVAQVAVATGLLLLLQTATGVRTANTSSQPARYTRLLLDPRVVNHSATSAHLLPGRPQKHPRNPLLTDKFRAPNNGATLEGKPRVLYDSHAELFKLWYDFPSCHGVDGSFSDTLYRQSR